MPIPFVGPSYTLATRRADVQRSVNMHLTGMETPNAAPFILESVPGLVQFADLGAALRGAKRAGSRAFAVAGASLYEVDSAGVKMLRGTLGTASGPVSMAYGLTQLVIADGTYGYVLTLASNAFARITDPDFPGASHVGFVDNYFTFSKTRSGQQFQITAINDATNLDALDFASAESSPDDIVAHIVDHSEVWLFGEKTTEVWFNSGAADFPFSRNRGASIEVGCHAAHSVAEIDSSVMWIGADENGTGMVYRAQAYQPVRISTKAVEEALQRSSDLTAATAYAYQQNGHTFYAINAPGLPTTWVYDVATGQWHERADVAADGSFKQHRGAVHVFAFGKHLVGGDDGKLYELRHDTHTNAGDPLIRERVTPHDAAPGMRALFFPRVTLQCTTGEAPQGVAPEAELSWSDDSGASWSNPATRSIGRVGERFARVTWHQLGRSRDRIWKVRCSATAPFSIINAEIQSKAGSG